MKIDNQTLKSMQADIEAIWPHVYKSELTEHDWNDVFLRHNLWFIAWCNRTYPDSNKHIIKVNGKRLLSFIDRDNYPLYPCGTNDTTIDTALRKIMRNIKTKKLYKNGNK